MDSPFKNGYALRRTERGVFPQISDFDTQELNTLEHRIKLKYNEYKIVKFDEIDIRVGDYMKLKDGLVNDNVFFFFLKYLEQK